MTNSQQPTTDNSDADSSVTPLELFSDLVFVFAVTQLTTVLVHDRTWAGVGHVLLLFGVIWWIYGGYIWVTNAVRPTTPVRKLLLLGSMAGFLIMGLAIPRAFDGDGVVFGIGYLVVVLIHAALFSHAERASTFAGIVRVAPFNVASAILLIIAGVYPGRGETVLWILALAVQIATPFLSRTEGFHIEPGHFVERYGLLVLIVLGESVVAVGAIGQVHVLGVATIAASVLGLALTAALWWSYFAGDETGAEEILGATPVERRPVRALAAFFYAQIPMLLGIVAIAAAIRIALPHPTASAGPHGAWLLAGGATAYLVGDLGFRTALEIPRGIWRTAAAPLLLATASIGLRFSTVAQLAVLTVVFVAALVGEAVWSERAGKDAKVPAGARPSPVE